MRLLLRIHLYEIPLTQSEFQKRAFSVILLVEVTAMHEATNVIFYDSRREGESGMALWSHIMSHQYCATSTDKVAVIFVRFPI